MIRKITFVIVCLLGFIAFPQATIKGTVFDEYLEPFSGAIINSPLGNATSDFEGAFSLNISKLPVTIKVSSVGYSSETILVTDANQEINVILKETFGLDQVVISASRTPERIMESPVTIERVGDKYLKNTASPNFYESLKNLKGINILDNNYLTKIVVSNRGFANTNNVRFVQLVDGVDTAVPVFDYSLGNVFGVNELDLDNLEILPGPSSALYGANAINGILSMKTKNPFEDTGVSAYIKTGATNADNKGSDLFYDVGVRAAHKFNDWFAAKVNINYEKAHDWVASDLTNINGAGTSHANGVADYDGVNVYGDDFTANFDFLTFAGILNTIDHDGDPNTDEINLFATQGFAQEDIIETLTTIPNSTEIEISRTGINESDLVDYNIHNLRLDGSLHFKPWGQDKTEIILGAKYSQGNNITTGSNRYYQKNSSQQHYKFEFKGLNYFLRGYYSENASGDTYDAKLAATHINNSILDNPEYFLGYV